MNDKGLRLDIEYKDGSTQHITNNLNEKQARALTGYMESGKYGMEKATITATEGENKKSFIRSLLDKN